MYKKMNDTEIKLKGVKQVLLSEFREAVEADAVKGYLWFVRENEATYTNEIYLGSKLYGTAEIKTSFENFIINVVSTDNVFVVKKSVSPEGTTVNLSIKINPEGGLVVSENGIGIDTSNLATKEELSNINDNLVTAINTINENVANGFITINENVANGFNTINGAIDNELRPGIEEAKKLSQDETNRALEAETNLQSNINVETTERKLDVESLQNNINVETTERKLDVESLQSNINAETERAKLAEADLLSKIDNGSSTIHEDLQKEIDRALEAENQLLTLINAESERAISKEEELNQTLQSETNRATEAETQLRSDIESETSRATEAETSITNKINEEIMPSLENSVKYTSVSTEEMPNRKAIVLENHDILLGKTTDGSTYNLAMISKWNKADYGSSNVELNLNGSAERPTYNDSHEIALMDDVDILSNSVNNIKIEKDENNDLLYKLYVGENVCGEINIPKDQFLKEVTYDAETNILSFIFITTEGESTTNIDLTELIQTYSNGYGLQLEGNVFSVKLSQDEETVKYLSLSENGLTINGIDEIKDSITVKYIGNFNNSGEAEAEALKEAHTAKNALLTYTVNNTSNGIIVNNVINNENTKQYLYLSGKKYTRDITATGNTEWYEDSNVYLAKKGVSSYYLFSLTTGSSSEDIDKALTYLTYKVDVSDLDKCIKYGFTLIDEMYDQVRVGFDGQAYTFTKVGRLNPTNNIYACCATLNYDTVSGQFTVKNDSKKYIIASNSDISIISGKVDANAESIETISGKVDANAESIEVISGKVDANTSDITAISGMVTANTESIATVSGMTTANTESIATVSGKVDTNTSDITAISGMVTAYTESIATVSGKVDTNTSDIATVSGQVGTISEKSLQLETALSSTTDTVNTINETKIPEIESRIGSLENFDTNIPLSGITLNNNVSIKGRPNGETESPVDLLTLDDSNSVIVGSNIGVLNLKSKGRPIATIDGNEGEQIALLKDVNTNEISEKVNSNTASISSILDRLSIAEQKLSDLSKTNIESVTITPDSSESYNDGSKDYVINGDFQKSFSVTGNTVTIKNADITNDSRITISSTKDTEVSDCNFNGDFPKGTANAVLKILDSEYVTIKNVTFDATLYNAIEIGLSGSVLPKGVLFENCKFMGDFSNNAILIFGTQKDAIININNCYFQKVSNALRLSNRTNTTCTVNITNCKVDAWDVNSPWQGMVIMQDYTSPADKIEENNLFAPEKVSINVINCTGPNGLIKAPSNISQICGTSDENQIFYVWNETNGLVEYSEDKYPKISII